MLARSQHSIVHYLLAVSHLSIVVVRHPPVVVEELQAGVAVHLGEVVAQAVAAREEVVEFAIAEPDEGIILYGATIVHPAYVGPKAGAEAHVARLAGGVDIAPCEVVRAQAAAGVANGLHLAVGGGVVLAEHAVVAETHGLAVLHHHRPEGAAIAMFDTSPGLVDG